MSKNYEYIDENMRDTSYISENDSLFRKKEESSDRRIISTISDLLNNICNENENVSKKDKITYFEMKAIPSISLKDYLFRLYYYSKAEESTMIITLIYIDRLININNLLLTYYNIYKIILSAFISAMKYNDDKKYSMSFYSKLCGVSSNEINILELQFLFLIKYNLFIREEL